MTSIENFAGSIGVLYVQFMNGQIDLNDFQIAFNNEYQQARETHKDEITSAYFDGALAMKENKYIKMEDYYEKTYNQNK